MPRNRKSPQEKKALEYEKDHFSFGWRSSRFFPRTWQRKKKKANRQYRHRSQAILAQNKPGTTADDLELLADDLTSARFQKSVSHKRLHKTGTVTLKEKVRRKLKYRSLAENQVENQKNDDHRQYDQQAARAVRLLTSLEGKELEAAVQQANLVCTNPAKELKQIMTRQSSIDSAIYFVYLVAMGSAFQIDALKRNPSLDLALAQWLMKANRILTRSKKKQEEKMRQKKQTSEKIRAERIPKN